MVSIINSYALDTDVRSYGEALIPFNADSYRWASEYGRVPIFRGEKYYWLEHHNFMGKECEAMIAAIKDMIYKISFRFTDNKADICLANRERLYNFVHETMGEYDEIYNASPDHRVLLWKTNRGNVTLDLGEAFATEIVLTSSAVKKAKKRLFFKFNLK